LTEVFGPDPSVAFGSGDLLDGEGFAALCVKSVISCSPND
jgi:hypothetical protein